MRIKSIHTKIMLLVLGVVTVGAVITIYWGYKTQERELLDEKLRSAKLMSQPIIQTIYEDMLEERADMVRHLIDTLKGVEGAERVQIVRGNGTEEAFRDLKTIKAVEKEFGEIKPEWIEGHPEDEVNVAPGVNTPEFRKAFEAYKKDWELAPVHYIEGSGNASLFTYLHPIEARSKCNACHDTEEARGILMISFSLEEMYAHLYTSRNQWALAAVLMLSISGLLLSTLIRRSITGPVRETVSVIKRITAGKLDAAERVQLSSTDEIGYFAGAFNNMLDAIQKRNEVNRKLMSTLIKSREEWVSTFDAIDDLISLHDTDYRVRRVNMALARRLGVEPRDLIGKKCFDVLHKGAEKVHECVITRTLATGKPATGEADGLSIDGIFEIAAYPIFDEKKEVTACVHIMRDVTEEKGLKEQLVHTEKISSIGKFVAGIAHELNNPLMGIMGFSQILMDAPDNEPIDSIKGKVRKIYREAERTAKIVQNLLTFARAGKSEKRFHDINDIIAKTMELKGDALKGINIEVATDFEANLPNTMIDFFQIQQVFINIINNAADAMSAHSGKGRLEIATRSLGRKNIEITIGDNGPGMPAEVVGRVFDPFFTTKEVGKGTGLGLSITHGIISEHEGSIGVNSRENEGTVFTITLPIVEEQKAVDAAPRPKPTAQPDLFAGKKVLIVDDEPSIREALTEILSSVGLDATSAVDGREALDRVREQRFDCLLADIKMPNIGGIELYETVCKAHPYLKDRIIMLTGDVLSPEIKEFFEQTGSHYVLKPFNPAELVGLIKKVLS